MLEIALAIAPVFLLILVGYALAAGELFSQMFWRGAECLTYFVLFPALLFTTLASARVAVRQVLPMAGAMAAAILVVVLLLLILRPTLLRRGHEFTSLLQGAIRFNTYIGLAIVSALYGAPGLAFAAAAIALIVPLTNLISIIALLRYGAGRRGAAGGALVKLVTNPLVVSCAAGIAVNLSGWPVPPVLDEGLAILAQGALPLGLLAVGAGLEFAAAAANGVGLLLASVIKLAALPALTFWACDLLGVSGIAAAVAVLFNALPTAPSAFVLARQLGGDARLMASVITIQVALAALSLPLTVALLRHFG